MHGDLAVSLVEDTDQRWHQSFTHGIAALVWAGRGNWSVAEAHVAAARAAADELGDQPSRGYAANAAIHLAFARQDWAAIIAAGRVMFGFRSSGMFEPGVCRWRELYDEALVAVGSLAEARRARGPARLSPREQSIVRLVARGLTNRQIAAELVISIKTVEVHLSHIFAKLEVSSRTQLAAKVTGEQAGT